MELRNIHFAQDEAPAIEAPAPAPAPPENVRLRLRSVTVSPLQEHALRPGEVRPISDSLAALICHRKGRAEISAKGIKVERKDIGGVRIFYHVDSRLCNDLSQRERKIFYVINSMSPNIIHLLDETGRYIESLPEKKMPGVLNNEEQAKEYADQRRHFSRVARHMQELHADDTREAIETARANNTIAQRIVQVMPSNSPSPANAPAPSPLGDRIAAGSRRINDGRKAAASAIAFGRAASLQSDRYTAPAEDATPAEDWSDNRRRPQPVAAAAEDWSASPPDTRRHQTPTETEESW